ncbi:MAG: PPC domain-containing protein [Gemmataceae bacterium]|nr:PPC domain-containing protein [Gemmataceae bacterium]MDW8266755.1 PPC domain-containing protein [Gemmataceae bacterium]
MRSGLIGLTVAALACGQAAAQTSYPMLTHAHPVAVQRGVTSEITVEARMNLRGAYKVLCEGTGINAEVVPPPPPKNPSATPPEVTSLKLKVDVAATAMLGVREFRIATARSLSSLGQLVVVDDPVVVEAGDNNTLAKANPLPVPGVACGRLEVAEDVDYFKFHAEAGQHFTFEIFCARLQDKIHDLQKHADPYLALYDAEGRELTANDDFYFADSLMTYRFTKAGDYYLQVRESRYDGDPRWVYAVRATPRPFVTHLYPMAGNPGSVVEVEPVGSAREVQPRALLSVPMELGIRRVSVDIAGQQAGPAAFVVSPLPQVLEQEPNDQPEQATRVSIPCGINGRIGQRRDLDHFLFQGTKGKAIRFEVKARRFGTVLQSSLDSHLDVLARRGGGWAVVSSNDDLIAGATKDAGLVFTPPADGEYVLRIRDLHSRGGDTFVYFVEADWARPDFTLRCDPDKAMLGPGSSMTWYVHVVRSNGFDGPVTVEVRGLPKGVTASPLTIPPSMTQGVIVLTADAEAPIDAANVELIGTAVVKGPDGREETLVRGVTPIQEIYVPGGGRGRFDVFLQSVAVTEPSDILKVEVSPKAINLKPGEEVKLDVTIERRKDYDKAVSLDVMLRHLGGVFGNPLPPGVTVVEGKSKTLLGTGNKGHIVLRADPKAAPIENVPISVLCHVSINFVVKVSYSSPVIPLTIEKK